MRIATVMLGLALAGCTSVPPADAGPVQGGDGSCDAARAAPLVGRAQSEETGAEALRRTGATTLRWIRPGDMVTQDYRTDRLNIDLDANGRITGFRCG